MKTFIFLFLFLSTSLKAQEWKVFEFSLFEGDYIATEVIGKYIDTDLAIDNRNSSSPRIHIRINKLDGDIGVVILLTGLRDEYWYKEADCKIRYTGSSIIYDYLLEYIIDDTKGLFWVQSPLAEYKSIRYDRYTLPLIKALMENKEVYMSIKIDSHTIQCVFPLDGSADAIKQLLKYKVKDN